MEFIKYLQNCVSDTFSIAGIPLSIAELVCAVLWFWNRKRKRKSGSFITEGRIETAAKMAAVILILPTFFVISPYRQVQSERKANIEAQAKSSNSAHKLGGFIYQTVTCYDPINTNSLLLLQVEVNNYGQFPSVARSYNLQVIYTNQSPIYAESVEISDEYNVTGLLSNSVKSLTVKRADLISEKTSRSIPPGEAPIGWIAFKFSNLLIKSSDKDDHLLVLSFLDVSNKRIFVTNGISDGKPARINRLIDHVKTLPGSVNLAAAEDANLVWQPPLMPASSTNVTVFFGNQSISFPIVAAKVSPEASGVKLPINELPDFMFQMLEHMPDYSPRIREAWFRWESIKQQFGEKWVELPIIPHVVSNRCYIYTKLPFSDHLSALVISDSLDGKLAGLPKNWDRNYNSHRCVYEIVNERTNPVLQVWYEKPNEIHVNGIIVVDTNSAIVAFGGPPILQSSYYSEGATNAQIVGASITNALFGTQNVQQKPIFKYPSNRFPQRFADQ